MNRFAALLLTSLRPSHCTSLEHLHLHTHQTGNNGSNLVSQYNETMRHDPNLVQSIMCRIHWSQATTITRPERDSCVTACHWLRLCCDEWCDVTEPAAGTALHSVTQRQQVAVMLPHYSWTSLLLSSVTVAEYSEQWSRKYVFLETHT